MGSGTGPRTRWTGSRVTGSGKVRIRDVAARAGVSTATVSRVLANRPYSTPEIRQRVYRAVEELGYRPNRVARSLRVQRSSVVALIIPDIENPYFHRVVRGVQDVMDENRFVVFLCNTDEDLEQQRLSVDLVLAEQVAGILIAPVAEFDRPNGNLAGVKTPMVVLDRRLADVTADTVRVDNAGAAGVLVEHLIADGHRRIGAVLGTDLATTGRERREGYERALAAHGIPIDPAFIRVGPVQGPNRERVGYELTNQLLELPERPTALFSGTNLLTLGALKAIHDAGLSIPQDMAVAVFDEIDWMPIYRPSLTSIAQPAYEMGRRAGELLLRRMDEPHRPVEDIVFPSTLLIRQSCARHEESETIREIAPAPLTVSEVRD